MRRLTTVLLLAGIATTWVGAMAGTSRADDSSWTVIESGARRTLIDSSAVATGFDPPGMNLSSTHNPGTHNSGSDASGGGAVENLFATSDTLRSWVAPLVLLLLGAGVVLITGRTVEAEGDQA